MRLIILLLICITACWVEVKAQDPSFSQFYAHRIYLNPALTGVESGISLAAVHRNQWKNADTGFKTYGVSAEIQDPYLRSGFGISMIRDVQGLAQLSTTHIGLAYSYAIPIKKNNSVHIGLQARYVEKQVDWSKIVFSDQLDPVFGAIYATAADPGLDRVSYADFDLGIIWRWASDLRIGKKVFKDARHSIGLSINNAPSLIRNGNGNESLQNLNTQTSPRLTVYAGSIIPAIIFGSTKREISISPNIKYDLQGEQLFAIGENLQVLTAGGYILYEGMYIGAFYQNKHLVAAQRNTNAMIITVGTSMKTDRKGGKVYLAFSYDANTSGLGPQAGGVFEFAIRYTLATGVSIFGGREDRKSSRRPMDCKSFF